VHLFVLLCKLFIKAWMCITLCLYNCSEYMKNRGKPQTGTKVKGLSLWHNTVVCTRNAVDMHTELQTCYFDMEPLKCGANVTAYRSLLFQQHTYKRDCCLLYEVTQHQLFNCSFMIILHSLLKFVSVIVLNLVSVMLWMHFNKRT